MHSVGIRSRNLAKDSSMGKFPVETLHEPRLAQSKTAKFLSPVYVPAGWPLSPFF